MIRRLRSPSLFVTFAGAFLGVLIVGTLLQAALVVGLVRPLMTRLATFRSELSVRQVAQEIAAALAVSSEPDVAAILRKHSSDADSVLLVYRPQSGRLILDGVFPPRFAEHLERLLSGDAEPRRPPGPPELAPPGRPRRERPGFRRPPPDGGRPRGRPQILSRSGVVVDGQTVGEVVAVQLRPRFPLLPGPPPPFFGLLFLPIAILLAGFAGLIMFRIFLRRVRELEQLAARVAAGDLEARVADPAPDEIGRLGARLNRMTESLAAAKQAIEESDRQRRQLFADISHELATPLTSIRGYTETLLNAEIPTSAEEREEFLRHVFNESKRMDLLIEDLLELTRLEAGASPLMKEPLDWTALCRNTMRRFETRLRNVGLEILWQGPVEATWVEADGRRLEQVIDNLLMNALRYVPAGGSVSLRIVRVRTAPTDRYRLSVLDDGPGFPPDDLPHVFDRFYRGGAARSAGGTGLGLAIVREIVQRHDGSVGAENLSPAGAAIHIELPVFEVNQSGLQPS